MNREENNWEGTRVNRGWKGYGRWERKRQEVVTSLPLKDLINAFSQNFLQTKYEEAKKAIAAKGKQLQQKVGL